MVALAVNVGEFNKKRKCCRRLQRLAEVREGYARVEISAKLKLRRGTTSATVMRQHLPFAYFFQGLLSVTSFRRLRSHSIRLQGVVRCEER